MLFMGMAKNKKLLERKTEDWIRYLEQIEYLQYI